MTKPDRNGEFGYRRDMREWEKQSRNLKLATLGIVILVALVLVKAVGL